jgi:hypothetical protein
MTKSMENHLLLAMQVLEKVEEKRLKRAVEGLVNGAYTICVTSALEDSIEGFVTNDDGSEYSIVLTAARVFCSCRDAMYRHQICKHAVVLALHVVRNPPATIAREPEADEPQSYNLRLVKTCLGYAFAA